MKNMNNIPPMRPLGHSTAGKGYQPRFHIALFEFEFEFILFLQGQCTIINISVTVPVLASQPIFNRSPWAGY
jgi:hypothetical protein